MSTTLRLALRNLLLHPWRSLATLFGIGLGIAAVLTTLSVGANVEVNLRQALQAAAGKADLVITPGAGGRSIFATEPLLSDVRALSGVQAAYPVLQTRAEPDRADPEVDRSIIPGIDSGFQIQGRQTEAVNDLPAAVSAGSLPAAGSRGIAVADGFAAGRGIELGDEVDFLFSSGRFTLRVTGLLDDAVGIASTNGGRVGLMHLDDLQQILHFEGRISNMEVQVTLPEMVEPLQSQLEELAGEGMAVTLPAGSGNFTFGIVQTLQSGLSVLAATLLALGAFLSYNTFMASVVERRREYALLRTIALTRRGLLRLALYEALALAVLGVIAGVLLGILLSAVMTYLNSITFGYDFRALVMPVGNVLLASLLGAGAALIAGLLPALAASSTPPMAALQGADVAPSRRWVWLGALLALLGAATALAPWQGVSAIYATTVSLGLFFVGVSLVAPVLLRPATALLRGPLTRLLGTAGRLGAAFAERNASRNGVAIGTVVVGTGLVIGVGSMVTSTNQAIADWVQTTVVGDLFITAPVTFPDDFAARTEQLAGVDVASGVKITAVRFLQDENDRRGRAIALVLADPERFEPDTGFGRFQYIPGEGDDVVGYAALKAGQVLVANTMKDRYGIATGSEIVLRTSEGFTPFEVAGVVVDFTGGGETVVASIDQIDLFGGGNPDLYIVTVNEGVEQAEVRSRLLAEFPGLGLDVTLNEDYRSYILDITNQAFATTRVLLIIAVLVAALAVANTLGMNLVNRGHEIAVLRTIGLARGGVRTLITAEGMVVTIIGAVIGIGFGLLLSNIVTTGAAALTGFKLEPSVPWSLVLIALLASPLVGLLAAVFPARRAAAVAPARALAAWSEHV
ncbi:MAG: FtsX-like permease family protein [Trueperaceae bacterium]